MNDECSQMDCVIHFGEIEVFLDIIQTVIFFIKISTYSSMLKVALLFTKKCLHESLYHFKKS